MRRAFAALSLVILLAGVGGACHKNDPGEVATADDPPKKSKPKKADDDTPRDPKDPKEPTLTEDGKFAGKEPKKHRAKATSCPHESSRTTYGPRMRMPDGAPCKANADCKEDKNGRCNADGHCAYDACYADADCGKGGECVCNEEGKRGWYCMMGDCSIDADCGKKGYCSPSPSLHCGYFSGVVGNYCHTAKDECVDDDDCKGGDAGSGPGYCAFSAEAHKWVCGYSVCVG